MGRPACRDCVRLHEHAVARGRVGRFDRLRAAYEVDATGKEVSAPAAVPQRVPHSYQFASKPDERHGDVQAVASAGPV